MCQKTNEHVFTKNPTLGWTAATAAAATATMVATAMKAAMATTATTVKSDIP